MLWSLGFMVTFVIGGMTGVLLAVPPADFVLHNSLFLVAHFHNVIIGGVLFGAFAGYTYWFPKAFGFRLHEGLGKAAFWCWLVGFYVAFMPLYVLGLMGMTRRMQHYDVPDWQPWLLVAAARRGWSSCVGIVLQIVQLVVSIRQREALRDVTGDPWDGRSLEWATPSPPPAFNFAVLPDVEGEDAYWGIKQRAIAAGAAWRRARLHGHRDAAQQPDRLHLRLLRDHHGLRADLAHLVAGRRWPSSAPTRPSSSSPGATSTRRSIPADEVARIDRANRSARAAGARRRCRPRHERRCRRRRARRSDRRRHGRGRRRRRGATRSRRGRRPSASSSATASGSSCSATSSCSPRFFATYAVLVGATAGGPSGRELFDLRNVAVETACLLLSSFTCGLASIGAQAAQRVLVLWRDGGDLRPRRGRSWRSRCTSSPAWSRSGAGPTRSAFLSAFFALVGCHGLHVTAGLLWLLTMMAQVFAKGYRADILRRMLCFSLFWHALDIIWVALFTVVYLMGVARNEPRRADECPRRHRAGRRALGARRDREGIAQLPGRPRARDAADRRRRSSSPAPRWSGSRAFRSRWSVLAIAQMGVHLVFFLHITTGPDNTNNVMALAFGVLIVLLLHRRLALDHGAPEPQHDADGSDHADAALMASGAHRETGLTVIARAEHTSS